MVKFEKLIFFLAHCDVCLGNCKMKPGKKHKHSVTLFAYPDLMPFFSQED